jgi:ketosteroid isomerase-like protein
MARKKEIPMKIRPLILLFLLLFSGTAATAAEPPATWQEELFAAREAAWRGFFGDPDALAAILTEDFVAIDRGAFPFSTKAQVLEQSRQVTAAGVRLVSLAFPDNLVQRYGEVAIIYTTYSYTTRKAGGPADPEQMGRATELFRWDGRRWLHTGWHLGPAAAAPAP